MELEHRLMPSNDVHSEELRTKIYKLLQEDQSTMVQETFIGDLQDCETDEIMQLISIHTANAVREALEGVPVRQEQDEWDAVDIVADVQKYVSDSIQSLNETGGK